MHVSLVNNSVNIAPSTDIRVNPYTSLTPDVVLDALADIGLMGDGRLTALSSYENRVYQIHLETERTPSQTNGTPIPNSVVAKFYRPGRWTDAQIQEEHDFAAELVAAEVPVVPPLNLQGQTLHHKAFELQGERETSHAESFKGFAYSVSERRGGRPPELDDAEVLEWIGRFLARIHTVGSAKSFHNRPTLSIDTFMQEPRDGLFANKAIPMEVERAWQDAWQQAMDVMHAAGFGSAHGSDWPHFQMLRLHGDCHPGNILWTPADLPGGGPHFVDLDDARMGPAVQDLWMLLSGDRKQRSGQLSMLLDGYEQVRDFDRRELALIEPLRTLRLVHYSAWLARRWDDPIFPINFPWFGTPDYWRGQVQMLEEQIEQMQEPLLVV
jgi:Ser/Thr protein kinase RdoA (MazF antagonist)